MKALAILKDSYRETLDSKVFYVMLVLSGLLALFVGSISYRPVTPAEELEKGFWLLNLAMNSNPQHGRPNFEIRDARQTNDAAEPWKGDYHFAYAVKCPSPEDLKRAKESLPFLSRQGVTDLVHQGCYYLDNIQVSDDVSKDPSEVVFEVISHGTKVEDPLSWRYEPKIFFLVPVPFFINSMRENVYFIEDKLINGFGAMVAVLIGVVITASSIPEMLRKGAVDLLVAKPIRRPTLLLYKYLGGLIFVFLLTAATVSSIWLMIGLRTGIWAPGFLLVIPALTAFFAILYSVSTLAAVLTRSTVLAILASCLAWAVFWFNGWAHSQLDALKHPPEIAQLQKMAGESGSESPKIDPQAVEQARAKQLQKWQWAITVSDIFYTVLPRTRDLDNLTARLIADGVLRDVDLKQKKLDQAQYPSWVEVLGVSGAFIAVMLGLACWYFSTRDY
jgi:ABC-type transport system involved in multi-copper enzyme maturation permease subunit